MPRGPAPLDELELLDEEEVLPPEELELLDDEDAVPPDELELLVVLVDKVLRLRGEDCGETLPAASRAVTAKR